MKIEGEYQRFGEVLSDRASQALSIEMEIEMAVEKATEKERKEKEKAKKETQEAEERGIIAMIKSTDLLDKEIVNILRVREERVKTIRERMK